MISFFYTIYNNIYIKSIRRGLLKVQPIILINCIFIIILNINTASFSNFMSLLLSDAWYPLILSIYTNVNNVSKALIVISICTELARIRVQQKQNITYMGNNPSPMVVGFIGLASAIAFSSIFAMERFVETGNAAIIAANWSLLSIVVGILFSEFFISVYYYTIDHRKTLINSYERSVRQSILSILPAVITIAASIALAFVVESVVVATFQGTFTITIEGANSYWNDIKYIFIKNALWMVGGHGGDMIVHDASFNRLFVDTFTNMGGAGSTFCLLLAIFFCSKNKYSRKISSISMLPSLFNINEIITYGLPILFNPIFMIPLTIVPIIQYLIAYLALFTGVVEIASTNLTWTTPVLLNAYQLTGSFSGLMLQLINITVGVLLYLPFVQIYDTMSKKERQDGYEQLKKKVFSQEIAHLDLTHRIDNVGEISIYLGEELKDLLTRRRANEQELFLVYQPQVDKAHHVIGVESLLRWQHPDFGLIPPNITILIAEEVGLIYDLGKWIADSAIAQHRAWQPLLASPVSMSINISTKQLVDPDFASTILACITKYNVDPTTIKVELTESFAVGEDAISKQQLHTLSQAGVKLVIDDYGVGYNPLLYIKKYEIECIKIDGSLIRDIDTNEDSKRIVTSIYNLCSSTGIQVVNEFVETLEQKNILDALGNGYYQGYYFSKPLDADACLSYIKQTQESEIRYE
ncbi:MAG: EAL domain-containing protein [Erysipelotrichaceae bacterium]